MVLKHLLPSSFPRRVWVLGKFGCSVFPVGSLLLVTLATKYASSSPPVYPTEAEHVAQAPSHYRSLWIIANETRSILSNAHPCISIFFTLQWKKHAKNRFFRVSKPFLGTMHWEFYNEGETTKVITPSYAAGHSIHCSSIPENSSQLCLERCCKWLQNPIAHRMELHRPALLRLFSL